MSHPDFAEPLARLITEFKRLPGIGQKSAQRLAFHVLRASREDAEHLAQAVLDVKDKLGLCEICNNITDTATCSLCRDTGRDQSMMCVVEEPHNIVPIETTRQFGGIYHVLHGSISPLRGIGPEQLKITAQTFFCAASTRPARIRGSRRMTSMSSGGMPRAISISPPRMPSESTEGLFTARNSSSSTRDVLPRQ